MYSSCIALVFDSETAFLRFENRFLLICFRLLIIFFSVTRSYFSWLILQLCNIIVCLFPKLSLDIRFRMMNAILGLVISSVLNC